MLDALPQEQTARFERARSRSVFIATPVARNPVRTYTLSMLDTFQLLGQVGIRSQIRWVVGNSNLPRARNELVATFLASDCTDLLFIDDDMGWKAKDVIRILASDQDIIGGVGRKKTLDLSDRELEAWCCRMILDKDLLQDDMGAIEVLGIGTGFVKISRNVFERLIAEHPGWKRPGLKSQTDAERDCFYRFFHFLDEEGQLSMGEDFAFCEAWRALGGKVWADPMIELVHVGEHEFSGSFSAVLQPKDEVQS